MTLSSSGQITSASRASAIPRSPSLTRFFPRMPVVPRRRREWIVKHIAGSKHYKNKVVPLFLAGDEKQVRILVQLVRDQATSFDADFGAPVATVRHEVWQYTNQYGGWVKDRRTEVLDRILMARSEFIAGPGSGSPGSAESKWREARNPHV